MHLSPQVAFIVWIPVSAYFFCHYSARVAILANLFGGWAVLPGAYYVPSTQVFPFWVLGVCLPTNQFFTKATVIGLTALAGTLVFHTSDLKKRQPRLCDVPMAIWCSVPLISATTHLRTLHEGFLGAVYLAITWGVPWMLGRIYFSDDDSLLLAARACVIAGICYVPICLVEIFAGPQLYAFIYGYQPYRWVGAERYIGFRPIGMMEDGNQLGIWMAAATLIAVSLFARRTKARIFGLSLGWAAAGLAAVTLFCQSVGSILLLLFLLPLTLLKRRLVQRTGVAVLVLCMVVFILIRMTGLVPLRALAQQSGPIHSIASGLSRIGRQSLGWRLAREESHTRMVLQEPILGYGQWDWWQNGDSRPWSLWMLAFGMYGLVGLIALISIFFLPVARAVWSSGEGDTSNQPNLRLPLAALILMVAIDSLLNGAVILPYLLVVGGLVRAPLQDSPRPIATF